jgi:hypothetical protein
MFFPESIRPRLHQNNTGKIITAHPAWKAWDGTVKICGMNDNKHL